MILFDLKCSHGHGFEAWFKSGNAYEAQVAAGEIVCPLCGDRGVSKAPMAPRIARFRSEKGRSEAPPPEKPPSEGARTGSGTPAAPQSTPQSALQATLHAEVLARLGEMRRQVEENCDYVGDRFAEEARRIHYGEVDPRGIYGEASDAEAADLTEEGIAFSRMPWLPRTNS
jgi:hypothetical protein